MNKKTFLAALAACVGFCGAADAQALSAQQQQMALIAAFTANGDQDKLKKALENALNEGVTVNQAKEIIIQLYAYTGFPRSLNAVDTFMRLMQQRQEAGLQDAQGKEASPLPQDFNRDEYGKAVRNKLFGRKQEPPAAGYQLFTPVLDTYLKEHLFADIFVRDNLDYFTRELATISALAAMHGTQAQLAAHLGAAMNMGLTPQQAEEWALLIKKNVGRKEGKLAQKLVRQVIGLRQA